MSPGTRLSWPIHTHCCVVLLRGVFSAFGFSDLQIEKWDLFFHWWFQNNCSPRLHSNGGCIFASIWENDYMLRSTLVHQQGCYVVVSGAGIGGETLHTCLWMLIKWRRLHISWCSATISTLIRVQVSCQLLTVGFKYVRKILV